VIGYGFMAHGWAKLSRGPAGFAKLLEQIGAPLPEVTAWVSTLIEILGGLAILAGAFVPCRTGSNTSGCSPGWPGLATAG
jgi:putative oxidoreductase